ncbi:MAG: two-component system regulator [Schumannella sp.]|nr:two-component system regulator [Schumannella sp.]
MRILIVEDDPAVAAGIADGLGAAAIEVDHVAGGQAALDTLGPVHDLVVLDLGLPDMDGTDVCRQIRARSAVPIIIVSARGDEMDRVLALELGADDYLVKPFGMRELLARIRAVTRRTASSPEPDGPGDLGRLTIDVRSRRVTLDGQQIHLTPTEFDLLVYLAGEPGAVHRRSDILRDVWHAEWYGATKTLDAHVAGIRRKLGHPGWIESVRGIGFRFEIVPA